MDVTRLLAEFTADLTYDDLPPIVHERTRMFLLDGLGIMLGAVHFARANGDPFLDRYLDAVAPPGSTTAVGCGRRTTAMMAAFANGYLAEALDCQDTNTVARIHNGPGTIGAVLSLAEELASPGRAIMAAIVAGYEIGSRLGYGIQPAHWYNGFQSTGTLGCCGAAGMAAKLLELDGVGIYHALGTSGFILPISNGDNEFKGHTVKPVHAGQAAQCGISAAYLAQAGHQSGPLEGEAPRYHAVLHTTIGDAKPDLARIVRDLGEEWTCLEVGFKPYPVGIFIIGPVEVARLMMAEHVIDAADIETIDITTYMDAVNFTGIKYTTTESNFVDAHLSMSYCVAITLIDGDMTPRQLHKDRLADPAVHDLAHRIRIREDDEFNRLYPHDWPISMDIHLRGGKTLSRRIDRVTWSPRRPPTWDEVVAKFMKMSEPLIGTDKAAQAIEFVASLDECNTISPLMDLVAN